MLVARVKPRLAFVSPVFLFPNDAGGKIRTTNILRGMKGGAFDITLVSIASAEQSQVWSSGIGSVCDHFVAWEPMGKKPKWLRAFDLFNTLPVNVTSDKTPHGAAAVQRVADSGNFDQATDK